MPINPFTHLRLLNTTTTTHALSLTKTTLSLMKPTHSLKNTHFLSRIVPFKLKYLALSRPQHRLFSTRPRHRFPGRAAAEFRNSASGSGSGSGSGSKSLVDEEAELSDWVSELRTSSNLRGMVTSDEEESERFGARRTGRSRNGGGGERERDGFSVKRRRGEERGSFSRSDSMGKRWGGGEFGNDDRRDRSRSARSGGFDDRSDKRRGPFFRRETQFGSGLDNDDEKEEEEGYGSRSGKRVGRGNVGRRNGMRGGREQDSGLKRDRGGAVKGRGGFSENDVSGFDDTEGRETLMKGIGDLLTDEDSDDVDEIEDGDADIDNHVRSSFGFEKEVRAKSTTISSGKSDSYLTETRFDQCSISPLSVKAIKDAGYEKMTVVQEATLPIILKGKDVLAKAKTGTGKTVAFLLPSIEVVAKSPSVSRDQKLPPILVLVICPTRELATQAAAEADKLLKYHPSIGVQVVIGGTRLTLEQKRMQANPCQILVATPGRLRDHLENTAGFATRLMGVKVLVLDEADHLLDMGFRKDIEKIIGAVPKQRQTLLFSATVPEEVRQICHIALKRDHEFINTVQEGSEETHAQVRQMHLVAPLEKHFPLLYVLLKDHVADNVDYKVLVFCTTAMVTRLVADLLGELKLNVREIHSRKPQSYRTRVSDEFRKSKGLILVTSDVSARGVDYPDVTLVIQVGLPADREQYIHRLGRTGRKGKEGLGTLLLAPWEEFFLSTVKDLPITKAPMPSVDPDTKKMVERALSCVEMKNKESAYQAWLGYYNSYKQVGKDKYRLVELANEFSRCMGLDNPPAIPKLVLGKMGLRNIPGLRSK